MRPGEEKSLYIEYVGSQIRIGVGERYVNGKLMGRCVLVVLVVGTRARFGVGKFPIYKLLCKTIELERIPRT
jgi:hypothetical protein